jgi:hypothetical protein
VAAVRGWRLQALADPHLFAVADDVIVIASRLPRCTLASEMVG